MGVEERNRLAGAWVDSPRRPRLAGARLRNVCRKSIFNVLMYDELSGGVALLAGVEERGCDECGLAWVSGVVHAGLGTEY